MGALAIMIATTLVSVGGAGPVSAAAEFDPLPSPKRIVDTRADGDTVDNVNEADGIRPGGSTLQVKVAGRAGVPIDADAAVLNVTAVDATAPGFLTIWPCNQTRPNSSNVNYTPGVVTANAVFAGLDDNGRACIYSLTPVHVVVDVTGSMPEGAFDALPAPKRIADTRPDGDTVDDANERTGKVLTGQSLSVQVAGRAGIAEDATTAVLNLTVTDSELDGFLTVFPCDEDRPNSSNLNYGVNQIAANSVIARLDGTGKVCIYAFTNTNVILDVTGSLPETTFVPLTAPARLVDTRDDGETIDNVVEKTGYRHGRTTLQFPIAGRAEIPEDATAVILNVTSVNAKAPGYFTMHPRNSQRPNASNLNFNTGAVVANTVIAAIGGNGMACLFSSVDADAVVDVAGYFVGPAPVDTGVNCPNEFKPGVYKVGPYQFPAGRYVSTGNPDTFCEFYRQKTPSYLDGITGSVIIIGDRLVVDVLPGDAYVQYRFESCKPLIPFVPSTSPSPAIVIPPGAHLVNEHIRPGLYRATRDPFHVCGFLRLSAFDGRTSSQLQNLFITDELEVEVRVYPTDVGVLAGNGCSNWTRVGP